MANQDLPTQHTNTQLLQALVPLGPIRLRRYFGLKDSFITFVQVVRAVQGYLDGSLSVCVLGLQRLYGLPQLGQLRLLKETGMNTLCRR